MFAFYLAVLKRHEAIKMLAVECVFVCVEGGGGQTVDGQCGFTAANINTIKTIMDLNLYLVCFSKIWDSLKVGEIG